MAEKVEKSVEKSGFCTEKAEKNDATGLRKVENPVEKVENHGFSVASKY